MRWKSASRNAGMMLLVSTCLLLSTVLTPQVAEAKVKKNLTVNNTINQFTEGTFQRAEMTTYESTSGSAAALDDKGGVQVTPISIFKFQENASAHSLPRNLARMGIAVVGTRIFVIGGIAHVNGSSTYETTAEVYSAEVATTATANQAIGEFTSDWVAEPSLPAVVSSGDTGFTDPTAVVNSPAVVTATAGGKSYIYVIGGNTRIGESGRDFSSYAVRRATIGSNGRISTWESLSNATIPLINQLSGLQGASAVTSTINGTTYVYLIGGLQRYRVDQNMVESGSKAVFWAKVDSSTGKLVKPSNPSQEGWDRGADLDLRDDSGVDAAGLWDAAAVSGAYDVTNNLYGGRAIYVFGGQTVSNNFPGNPGAAYNAEVYQILPSATGSPDSGDWTSGTLPSARVGLGAVTFGGKNYLPGGAVVDGSALNPQNDMLMSIVNDFLELPPLSENGSNFLADEDAFATARAFHGTALVKVGESAYVYVLGGQSTADGNNPVYTSDIRYGKIGGEQKQLVGYPRDGWYYSNVVDFNFSNAEVQNIRWGTYFSDPNNGDIEISYRVANANTCSDPGWTFNDWKPIDGNSGSSFSQEGANEVTLDTAEGRCFQYRARLVSLKNEPEYSAALGASTPTLLYLSLLILLPGSPDIRADLDKKDIEAVFNADKQLIGFNVRIRNHNDKEDLPVNGGYEPTQNADSDGSVGSFFVDIFIYKDQEPSSPPTIPVQSDTHDIGCTTIPTSRMTANQTYQILSWADITTDPNCTSNNLNLLSYFAKNGRGTYYVYLVVDSYCDDTSGNGIANGCIDETDALNGESNNVIKYSFTLNPTDPEIPVVSYDLSLPMISK
ncbi:hypothetical protein F8S13_23835 [Chloroflexia bacterium SDU3-3]|nr:hypothetical protein F8S13_23835 [Chloroflexia bacterium SDU3-3]